MKLKKDTEDLFKLVTEKSSLKNEVYNNTLNAFNHIKDVIENISNQYQEYQNDNIKELPTKFEVRPVGKFELDLKFGGDILLFLMHTNVFEFPRQHEVMRTSYVKEDNSRSYCGVINIYNFIADSFKYNRVNDVG